MGYKVLIPQKIADAAVSYLEKHNCEIVETPGTSEEELARAVKDCDAIIARTAPYTKAVIEAGKKLKVIARAGIGVDNIDCEYAASKGIWVTNGPTSNINAVAEHTMYLILCCAKLGSYTERCMREGNFQIRNRVMGMELEGKTLGIVGLGKIGRLVAQKASLGFGMKITGYDPYLKQEDVPACIQLYSSMRKVFETADFVSLHLPALESTKRSIGNAQFAWMKPTAYLINAARGEVVNEEELIMALESGRIAGAGLDVYEKEPPAADHPLLQLDHVVLSPHFAAMTKESLERMGMDAAKGAVDVLEGRIPLWPVNQPAAISK